ncbi:MAG: flagellar M-ring protein FliF [Methylibium sp. NZG]|nr:MAG: flagellar M-ring protein FliF [Methylibium sp. NZG]
MDNAVALNATATPPAPTGMAGRLAGMPAKSKLALGLGVAALAAVVLAMTVWNSQGDYKVLYANLSDKDGGAIIAQLSQMGISYRHADGGAAILVPASKVHDARLKLASAGLPKGSVVGFELMDSAKFGQTQFQERLSFQRGLEGELTRSITSMAAVQGARVHLALPNQNGFFREQQKPSASVLLTLHSGRALDRAQIAGIVHLVSSSVPEMNPKAVSVLDQTGALLSGAAAESGNGSGLDATQLRYVNQVESGYSKRILELLEPVIGQQNLRASVTAEVDFAQSEDTSEEFKPNQGAGAATTVRSQQTTEQTGGSPPQPSGVPGAASNQPPVAATAPLTGAAQPLQTAQGGGAGSTNSRRDAVTNFEVSKTVRVTRNATGTVKRLNAAVVVNNRTETDATGKTTQVALAPEEIEKLTALVKEAIGFKQERGDSVKVINAPFRVEPVDTSTLPWWKQPQLLDILRASAMPAGLALVAMVVFFGMIRPSLKVALAPPPPAPSAAPGRKLDTLVDDHLLPGGGTNGSPALGSDGQPLALEGPGSTNEKLEQARKFTRENPAAAANIVRGWVSGEPA